MLQFVISDGPGEARTFLCAQFPFFIGRSLDAAVQLTAPGVWDRHAQVGRDSNSGELVIQPLGEAFLLINGTRSEGKTLAPGDEIQIGAVRLTVSFSPVIQRSLFLHELPLWLILGLSFIVEIALLLALK